MSRPRRHTTWEWLTLVTERPLLDIPDIDRKAESVAT